MEYILSDGDAIERLLESMKSVFPKDMFADFTGAWGFRGSENFLRKEMLFCRRVREYTKQLPVRCYLGEFYMFTGEIYVKVSTGVLHQAYSRLLEALDISVMIMNKKAFEQFFIGTVRYYNALIPRFDVIAFSNGVLDMRDMSFNKFDEKYHCLYKHPYPYRKDAKCPKWNEFLREVLPDKNSRCILQMFLGLGLIERGTIINEYDGRAKSKVELCLILLGAGNNGKSVIYQTAMGVYGKDKISGLDYDELTATGDEGMRARRLLRGALFNWSSDSDSRTFGKKRAGVFKRIVSGEPVTDRKIGEDVQENLDIPYLVFNINELPSPDEGNWAFIRRLQYISFDVVIPKDKQNPQLAYELMAEYPGIFNWIMRGAKELRRRKYTFPDSESNKRNMLMTLIRKDPVAAWVKCYGLRPRPAVNNEIYNYISTKDMLESVTRFCEDNCVEIPSKQKFGTEMRSLGFYKKRDADGFSYQIFGKDLYGIKQPFVIDEEEFATPYVEESGTFITDED